MEYLIFKIGKVNYSISLDYVQEIIENKKGYHKLPKQKECHLGLLDVRGNIIHIINTAKSFNMDSSNPKEHIIIIKLNNDTIGLEVDCVTSIEKDEFLEEKPTALPLDMYIKNILLNTKNDDILINMDVENYFKHVA